MANEIRVPSLGESVTEATVGQWFKKPGEAVAADEPVVELETDKVTVEVPAPAAGVLSEIAVKEGETVEVGAILGAIEEGAPTKSAAKAAAAPAAAKSAEPAAKETRSAPRPASQRAEIRVPGLGESVTEATVGKWLKGPGEAVAADEPVVELETDKVSVEVPSPTAGVLSEIAVKEGETVEVGAILGTIEEGAAPKAPAGKAAERAPRAAETAAEPPAATEEKPLSPSVRKMLAENDLDPSAVRGTGKDGRILKEDVLKALEGLSQDDARSARIPSPREPARMRAPVPLDDEAREERVAMTKLRQTIARRLKEAQDTAAMLTTFNEVDMSAVMALRSRYRELFEKRHGVRLGFMSFFVKACVQALRDVPEVNAEIDGTDIVYKNYYHIGIAVSTERGLVVPVVREADHKSLAEIESAINEFAARARDGRLAIEDMQGGTFTITNGGIYGSLNSTPILNAPQSGILGMHKIQDRPVAVNGEVVIRPMMYLALTYDHRVVDGQGAVTFLVRVKECLEDPARLVLGL